MSPFTPVTSSATSPLYAEHTHTHSRPPPSSGANRTPSIPYLPSSAQALTFDSAAPPPPVGAGQGRRATERLRLASLAPNNQSLPKQRTIEASERERGGAEDAAMRVAMADSLREEEERRMRAEREGKREAEVGSGVGKEEGKGKKRAKPEGRSCEEEEDDVSTRAAIAMAKRLSLQDQPGRSSSAAACRAHPFPPDYDHPAHAPENDDPHDVVVGPGRPFPPPSSAPQGRTAPPAIPPRPAALSSPTRQPQQPQQQQQQGSGTPKDSISTANMASSASPPSRGGLVSVEAGTAPPIAREDVLNGVQWGFVNSGRAAMHPPLDGAGEFPRAAQMSSAEEDGGKERYRCFSVEAKGWQSLLVYLMWHGNSRLEAAPSDLQLDKSNRGLQASLSLDFFRSFTTHAPRVRITLTLLPLSHATPLSAATAPNSHFSALPVDRPALESDCPSIRLALPAPLTLPLPLSAIATTLSHAHTASRERLRAVEKGVTEHSQQEAGLLADRATLARAIDLFGRLGGEKVEGAGADTSMVEEAEVSMMDRLKARLRRTKRATVLVGGRGAGGSGGSATGGSLPESAMLINPLTVE
ncbi:hypothetical protein JCM6882_007244 [Rhodosporidiobolus microsporus]